jgi:hypothetical protein
MRGAATALTLVGILLGTNAGAQNLLANPDFDEGVAGWGYQADKNPAFQVDDESGCPGSGSILLRSQTVGDNFEMAAILQCLPIDGLTSVAASISFREGASVFNVTTVSFHLSNNCTDSEPVVALSSPAPASPGVWTRVEIPATEIPKGTQSIEFGALGANFFAQRFSIEFDRSWFGSEERIFAADFETDDGAGEPCRWSTSAR